MKTLASNKIFKEFIIPYLVIFLVSLCGCFLLFYVGFPSGDDSKYHFAQILDEYTALLDGTYNPISGNLAAGIGIGKRLFYSPMPHMVTSLISIVLTWFNANISLLTCFKFTLFLSIYISGIFMYHFGYKLSKGRVLVGIITAAIFVIYPYRMFDAFCRVAFAEAFSFIFLPLFFMGLYDFTHIDSNDIKIKPFVEIILGGSLLFLSHNLTALFAYVFGVFYLLFYIKQIFSSLKNKKYLIYCITSVFLLIGITSVNLFSQLELMNMNYYNVSVEEYMWTNPEAVVARTLDAINYSGFLNYPFLNYYININSLTLDFIWFILICSGLFILDLKLNQIIKIKYSKLIRIGIFASIISILFLLLNVRVEVWMAVLIVIVLFATYILLPDNKEDDPLEGKSLIYLSCIIILVLILITQGFVWTIMPEIFRKIQFPWRLWAFIQLFIPMIIAVICRSTKYYNLKVLCSILITGLLMVGCMAAIEKRLKYESDSVLSMSSAKDPGWFVDINESIYNFQASIGSCREYCPTIYYPNSNYKSSYENSLYDKIDSVINSDMVQREPYAIDPQVLTGNASIIVNDRLAPKYDMNINVEDEALIQMPLLYYPGYEIKVTNLHCNKTYTVDVKDIDGLISFELEEGSYKVTTNYVGTTARSIASVYYKISVLGLFVFIGYGVCYPLNKKTGLFFAKNSKKLQKTKK